MADDHHHRNNHPLSPTAATADDDDLDEDDVVSTQSDSDDDVDDPCNASDDDVVLPPSTSPSPASATAASSAAVTVAVTPPPPPPAAAAIAAPVLDRKPIDDSRRLFQRLWTDEDEIELLRGFLEYTSARGGATAAGHHHDTAAFYDQIKNKLQLEFNKNQLVEKLRRLKKKYRNVLSKMNSGNGKEFVFKSPHDQATFEISSKIWCNLSTNYRGGGGGGGVGGGGAGVGAGAIVVADFDDDDQNPNPNPNYNPLPMSAATPPRPPNSSYVISHINLNSASSGGSSGGGGFDMSSMNSSGFGSGALSKLSTRKKPRIVKTESGTIHNNNNNNNNASINNNNSNNNINNVNNIGLSTPLQGFVEETVRSCLSPVLKDLINSATAGANVENSGFKGVGVLSLNAVPLNYSGVKVREDAVMDEKWRKQQILELEVYSRRLELVQDQIKLSLEELRSMES